MYKAFGNNHKIILKSNGEVLAIGDNLYGQCDIPKLSNGNTYIKVACSYAHTVLLKSDNTVNIIGLELSNNILEYNNKDIIDIKCGTFHIVLLKKDGTVVFINAGYDISKEENNNIKEIACGGNNTILLKNNGSILSFGNNQFGQLDIPKLEDGYNYGNKFLILQLFIKKYKDIINLELLYLSGELFIEMKYDSEMYILDFMKYINKYIYGIYDIILPNMTMLNKIIYDTDTNTNFPKKLSDIL